MSGASGKNGHADFTFSIVRGIADEQPADTTFRRFMTEIRDGRWRREVEELRDVLSAATARAATAGLAGKEFRDAVKNATRPIKTRLPGACFSGTFSYRDAEHLKAPSGLICADLDDLNERVESIRDIIVADPHTLGCAISPSGTGLKVVFRIDPSRPHLESFRAAKYFVRENFGLDIDAACKDINRLCFVTYDPDAFMADDALVLPYPPADEIVAPPAVTLRARVDFPVGFISPGDDFNARGDWQSLVRGAGWKAEHEPYWCRPGKEHGISASWGVYPDHFHVFTDSAPPLAAGNYRPFALFAFLQCGGDFQRASDELYGLGFGTRKRAKAAPDSAIQAQLDAENEQAIAATNGHSDVIPDEQWERIAAGAKRHAEPPEPKIKPFTLWSPSQFLAFVPDPSACLLGTGYIELGQWTSLIGIGGLGKTRLALWFVVCQILNRRWCDIPTNGTPQKSVILSTENGLRRWKEDLTKILGTLTEAERAVVEAHVRILAMTEEEDGDLCLGDDTNVARLKLTLSGGGYGIVIFDPFADMMAGDENKTSDLVATITTLRSITRTCCPKAAILIIHHGRTGSANVVQAGDLFNAGNFGRGAKALYSKVRCEIQLAPEDRDNPNRLVLACGKANDTVKFAPRCLVFQEDDFTYRVDPAFDIDAWRDDVSGHRKKPTVTIADLVNAVHEKCPIAGDEISSGDVFDNFDGSGVTKRTLQRYVASAIESGYLRNGKKRFMIKLGSKPLPK